MSKYTTGEIAKLCGVSVRTVQYYDERGILIPSELSEGGRRLYSEDDYKKLKIICFLRDAGISIKSIGELLSESNPMLRITNLKKHFGDKEVLTGLNLSVPEHSVFGFVGENGAGKTTTMKIILGLLKSDRGEVFVSGERVKYGQTATNRYIGYLPDVPEFYSFMTAREYLRLCGESLEMGKNDIEKRSDELLTLVGLSKENHRIRGFSRGMKQRLGIAQALLGRPKILICDEPTSALDPIGRKEILDILLSSKKQTTVLFSTHILSDVERICTDVAFLNNGKIAMQGAVSSYIIILLFDDYLF